MAISLSVDDLNNLVQRAARTSAHEVLASEQRNVPFMYRAIQQPPQFVNQPMLDTAIGMVAPALGRMFGGMQNPVFMPTIGSGVSPMEGYYARDVTGPLYERSRTEFLQLMGSATMGQLGQIGANFGINRLAGVGPGEFQQNMAAFGRTELGGILTEQLLAIPAVQRLAGGDPMALHADIFA